MISNDIRPLVRKCFEKLAATWKAKRGHSSKIGDLVSHPSYQKIIDMGYEVVPLLLEEMKERPDHWDYALRKITCVDPVPEKSWGKLDKIAAAWVEWGKKKGYFASGEVICNDDTKSRKQMLAELARLRRIAQGGNAADTLKAAVIRQEAYEAWHTLVWATEKVSWSPSNEFKRRLRNLK